MKGEGSAPLRRGADKERNCMLKVAKFGGSSVAGAEQFRKVKAIVDADPTRRVVVSSAAGKR